MRAVEISLEERRARVVDGAIVARNMGIHARVASNIWCKTDNM